MVGTHAWVSAVTSSVFDALLKASHKATPMPRCAAAGIVRAVAATGGPGLWADSGYRFDEAVRNGIALLEDGSDAVRDAFAVALGELAAACKSGAAQDAVSWRCSVASLSLGVAALPLPENFTALDLCHVATLDAIVQVPWLP